MHEHYEPRVIETECQRRWLESGVYEAREDDPRPKFYCLSMLPYPSGTLHMGHVRNYTIGDVIARYWRLNGCNVLQPMGWDAFGLPAENAAIKHRTAPAAWTRANIAHMRRQLQALGLAIDWSREFATCDPEYYVHEQRLFVRLFEQGLVYRRDAEVNWDPVDQTVLANEQVIDGRGWRSGAPVEKRRIPQWFLKITAYAQELLDGLDHLDGWPESVKTMQRHWIGRSAGWKIRFVLISDGAPPPAGGEIEVFTTRPDTLYGATYLAVAADHPLAAAAAGRDPEVARFIAACRQGGTAAADLEKQEKQGVPSGFFAAHPLTGERLPVWVANFVLMSYGTGAVMAVPGHDGRDFEFARRYGLPIRQVITVPGETFDPEHWQDWYADKDHPGMQVTASGALDGLGYRAACDKVAELLGARAEVAVQYRLRDWGVSRQRYWGCPIPMILCPGCGDVPVPEQELPVVLPEAVEFVGHTSPLKADPQWRKTTCPRCGGPAERETDTFDTFMESSWYYARYCCPGAADIVDRRADHWLPVDQYIGGIEHAILHLMYFRFFHKLLRDGGYVHSDEPAVRLLCQGMVVAETFYRDEEGGGRTWFNPSEVEVERDERGRITGARALADGRPIASGGIEKMSKSRNNGVDPEALIGRYGADTVRLFSMFAAPAEQSLEWSESGVEGAWRFLHRLWHGVARHRDEWQRAAPAAGESEPLDDAGRALRRKLHETIAKVGDDIARRLAFNTAIAALMELINEMMRYDTQGGAALALRHEAWSAVVRLIAPFTPHLAATLWPALGYDTELEAAGWPAVDESALARERVTIVVQVNGKVRGRIECAPGADRETLVALACEAPNVARHLAGRAPRKVIVVPDKLLNLVV